MRDVGFDILRLLSIFGVIIMHTTSMYGIDIQILDFESFFRYVLSFSFKWSVPIFFMISGALLLSKNEDAQDFYSKRFKKVLFPTLFWSAIYLSIHYMWHGFSVFSLIAALLKANPYYHLWFMFALIGLYAFTPIFRVIIHNTSNKQRYVLIASLFLISSVQNYLNIHLHNTMTIFTIFIPYIGFYFLGYELRNMKVSFSNARLLTLFFISTFLIIFLGYLSQTIFSVINNWFATFLSPLVILQAITLFLLFNCPNGIKETSVNYIQKSSALVYGVYLIHPIFILLYINFYLTQENTLFNIFIATIFTVIMSFITTALLKKFKLTANIV